MNWLNIYGLTTLILMLLPNILYYAKNREFENKCKNKGMNLLEQLGRYGSMLFMILQGDVLGFSSSFNKDFHSFYAWIIITVILLIVYWGLWIFYFRRQTKILSILLAVIPSILFINNGFFFYNPLLVITGVLFSVGHIYVTYVNSKELIN